MACERLQPLDSPQSQCLRWRSAWALSTPADSPENKDTVSTTQKIGVDVPRCATNKSWLFEPKRTVTEREKLPKRTVVRGAVQARLHQHHARRHLVLAREWGGGGPRSSKCNAHHCLRLH